MSDWPRSTGLVGCGAMGRAMAAGLLRGRPELAEGLVVVDAVAAAADATASELGARVGSPADAAACDLIIVAVKPKDAPEAIDGLAAAGFAPGAILLSVVAGLDLDRLRSLAADVALARTMPNLAVRHGAGIIAVATRDIPAESAAALEATLEPLGAVMSLPESLIGPATALIGSGPGFVALVAEGLEDGAVAVGFPRDQARRMVQAVVAGSGALLADGSDPADLRQRVSSPAGTTIEGIAVLERGGVRGHIADAVRAAARRAGEL